MKRKNLWTPYKIWNERDWYQNLCLDLSKIKIEEKKKEEKKVIDIKNKVKEYIGCDEVKLD